MKQITTKGAVVIGIIIHIFLIISLVTLFIVPVKSYSFLNAELSLNIKPTHENNYYVYFPLFLTGDHQEFLKHVIIKGNGNVEMIETEFGITLNVSGKGPLKVNVEHTNFENISVKFENLNSDYYPIYQYELTNMKNLSVNFNYLVHTSGSSTNIYGFHFYRMGPGMKREGEDTLIKNGWQDIQTTGWTIFP